MAPEKKIVENIANWITLFDDGSVDRTWTGPPEAIPNLTPVPPHQHFVDGVAAIDVVADDGAAALKLRIYLPETAERDGSAEKLPVLLHFHGGGFCISQTDWRMYYSMYTAVARATGAVVVSPYLRRAPEHRLPAPCDDGFAALKWLRSVAAGERRQPWLDRHADFNRVFLIGDSSGACVVHQVAARAASENLAPLRLAGAIPIHPGFVRERRSKSETEMPASPMLSVEMIDKMLALALPEGATKDHPITCPMGEAAPAVEELNLPPYLCCVGEMDLMRETQLEFYEAMKRGKKEVELLMSSGVGHCFYLNKTAVESRPEMAEEYRKLIQGIALFVKNH
ncbi:probable carboxylesterase 15 [Andrographis paniculata]|uniref:probable carboxylesterase 15 n=1 Tax=Andrographis paniculata TaxID=175694 RepID=UPI0021E8C45F|nr:probable carboxylesterase 15 [Andrographis paniculata]